MSKNNKLVDLIRNGKIEKAKELIKNYENFNEEDQEGNTAFFIACKNGYLDIVKMLIENKADINQYGYCPINQYDGFPPPITPLAIAIRNGHQEIVNYLLSPQNNFDIHINDNEAQYFNYSQKINAFAPIHTACEKGDVELVQKLIEKGGDPNLKDPYNCTPLMYSLHYGKLNIFKILLDTGKTNVNDVNNGDKGAVHFACEKGFIDIIKDLQEKGAEINKPDNDSLKTTFDDNCGYTPLMYGLEHKDIVKFLVNKGAQIDTTGSKKRAAIHLACINGNSEAVEILIENNANLNEKDMNGLTPLMLAAIHDHPAITKILLLSKKIAVNVIDNQGHTAFYWACKKNSLEVVKILVEEKDIDLTIPDSNGYSAFHEVSNTEILQFLVDNKHFKNLKTKDGLTPLMSAAQSQKPEHKKVLEILLNLNDVTNTLNETDNEGNTALHMIISNYYHKDGVIVAKFLENKADITIKNKNGDTPFNAAFKMGKLEIVKLFLNPLYKIDDNDKIDAFHYACGNNDKDLVELFIKNKILIDVKDQNGVTPFIKCVNSLSKKVLPILIENGADILEKDKDGNTATDLLMKNYVKIRNVKKLEQAETFSTRHLEEYIKFLKILINKGVNIPTQNEQFKIFLSDVTLYCSQEYIINLSEIEGIIPDFSCTNTDGETRLHLACKNSDEKMVKFLIEKGVDITIQDSNGFIPIIKAICSFQNASSEIVKLLLEQNKFDINDLYNGQTLLHHATKWGHLNIVKLLVEKGANISLKNESGELPIVTALTSKDEQAKYIVKYLATKIENFNINDLYNGQTLLHYACEKGDKGMIELLIDNLKANPAINDKLGNTALMYAINTFNTREVQVDNLLKYLLTIESIKNSINNTNNSGKTAIHFVTDLRKLEWLIKEGADINLKDKEGNNVIDSMLENYSNITAQDGYLIQEYLKSINYLLKKGLDAPKNSKLFHKLLTDFIYTDFRYKEIKILEEIIKTDKIIINFTSDTGQTLLHIACLKQNLNMIELLLENGADPKIKDIKGNTALPYAKGNTAIIDLLMSKGQFDSNDLIKCCNIDKIKSLIKEQKLDIHYKDEQTGVTAVQLLCLKGDLEIIKILVEKGANFNLKDNNNNTIWHYAISNGSLENLEFLFSCDLVSKNINSANSVLQTPLRQAILNGKVELTEWMIKHNVDLNLKDDENNTTSHYATSCKNKESSKKIVELLITNGKFEYNAKNDDSNSPLHFACAREHSEIAKLLIENNSNVNLRNNKNKSPLDFIKEHNWVDILNLFTNDNQDENLETTVVGTNENFEAK